MARQTFLGLRVHMRLTLPGVITDFRHVPANVQDLEVRPASSQAWKAGSWVTAITGALPSDKHHWPHWLSRKRYLIDTVFSQLTERFLAKRVWARDAWHFFSHLLRKILSHTIAIFFCQQMGLPALHFAELITD